MVANHNLAQAIEDASFGEFRRELEYKCARAGVALHVVDRFYPSSKTCSACWAVKAKLPLSVRTYRCDVCGLAIDRDLNAAINIMVADPKCAWRGRETEGPCGPEAVPGEA